MNFFLWCPQNLRRWRRYSGQPKVCLTTWLQSKFFCLFCFGFFFLVFPPCDRIIFCSMCIHWIQFSWVFISVLRDCCIERNLYCTVTDFWVPDRMCKTTLIFNALSRLPSCRIGTRPSLFRFGVGECSDGGHHPFYAGKSLKSLTLHVLYNNAVMAFERFSPNYMRIDVLGFEIWYHSVVDIFI